MKLFRTVVILSAMALSLNSCDFFRSLVGKPTSAQLEQMRIEAQKKAEREKFVADSIKAAQEAAALAAQEAAELPPVSDTDPRFHVIVGCFKVEDNAVNYRELLSGKGYTPKRIMFKNGFDAVSLIQEDSWWKAQVAMENFMNSPLCPDDIWIYDMHQKLHE